MIFFLKKLNKILFVFEKSKIRIIFVFENSFAKRTFLLKKKKRKEKENPYYSWTERDTVVRSAGVWKEASRIITIITIGMRALFLEEHRVVRGWARGWGTIIASATVLWLIELHACAIATNHYSYI
jgi:hypothetical protein